MKKIIIILFLSVFSLTFSQRQQRIAYIDMEYILSKIPEYLHAQNALETKVDKWKTKLNKESRVIEIMKSDLANEKAILTKELIEEREEDIMVKEKALRKLESLYFGAEGDMYNLRKQLIKPIQDQVYNAVQNIAKKGNYDFVFDKSSDLVVLYSNKKYDISNLVIKIIKIDQKKQDRANKISEKNKLIKRETLTDSQKKKIEQKEQKRKQIEERRRARKKALEEKRRILREKREAYRKQREKRNKENKEKKNK